MKTVTILYRIGAVVAVVSLLLAAIWHGYRLLYLRPMLRDAWESRDMVTASKAIRLGAPLDTHDRNGYNLLMWAPEAGSLEMVQQLLRRG